MGDAVGTMVTMTTYGTWLRGDQRGWVDEGLLQPPAPSLEEHDRELLLHDPWEFHFDTLIPIGESIGKNLQKRLNVVVLALTVQQRHSHFVIAQSDEPIGDIVKCAKDAARWQLRVHRPLWTEGCDKRFCYDEQSLEARIRYVNDHNVATFGVPHPWSWPARH
jgi:hypothetical protein